MRRLLIGLLLVILAGCGTLTVPAAVRLSDGTVMIGTATAAVSGGTFAVATSDSSTRCSGTYNALDTTPTISVPVVCSDGRYADATVTRSRDGMSGTGFAVVSDGTLARVAFGNNALTAVTPIESQAQTAFPTDRAPAPVMTPRSDVQEVRSSCCKICRTGIACGDSCISAGKQCRKGRGCACNG
ncbi:MAG TPA: hypothetical protein VGN97_12420 [Mesorhizobium sp.]|jgi:hypothetical protein|nr:hypothetical protein [Mesorhizobium sp.]